jgi:phospholipase/carboxylesterase
VPSKSLIEGSLSEANRATPVFAAHGTFDDVLPLRLGEQGRDFALAAGCPVEWHAYPMAHSVCLEEIEALREWLAARWVQGAV